VPFLKGKALLITILKGGMTNRIFKVEDVNDCYVLRVFGAGTEHLGIDRDREVACSEAAAKGGVGAEVSFFLREHNALLTRFVPGKLLDRHDVQKPEILRRIAATLRACHASPVDDNLGTFDVFHTVRKYVALAGDHRIVVPAAMRDALVVMHQIEKELATSEPSCLCHNDLLAGNFIDDGTTMHIIDWEYGGRGNRYFDLGNFAANLQLTDEQELTFLQGYFGEIRPEDVRRLKLMRLASDLREASWGFVQQALSKLPAPKDYESYFHYGEVHLKRMLEAARALD
jgi:thiamine kinase-like enzyme